jgi:predicted nucleic acid binding AN1-type Zn finger protein
MVNCKYIECKSKISKIIGHCKSCEQSFCSKHRLPESHSCSKLQELRLSSKQELIKRLQENALEQNKLVKLI